MSKGLEVLTGDMDFFTIYTLIDITNTGNTNPKGNSKTFLQAQNYNSIIQALSLRGLPVISSVTTLEDASISKYDFGSAITGKHSIWILKFASEKPDIWRKEDDHSFHLLDDIDGVPIYSDLDNTWRTDPKFIVSGTTKNTYVIYNENI